MATATEHGRVVLSGVAAFRGTATTGVLDYAVQRIRDPEWFTDLVQRNLFVLMQRYADQTGEVLTRPALEDLLRGYDAGRVLMYGEAFDALCALAPPSAGGFRHSVSQLRELAAERATTDGLMAGLTILRQGLAQGSGDKAVTLHGHAEARQYVLAALAAVERDTMTAETPEGDVRSSGGTMLTHYAAAQQARLEGRAQGVLTGITALDRMLKGSLLRPGQMGIVAGYTSAGKTAFCCQTAWHVATQQRKNVVYLTTETLLWQVMIKLAARHSRLPQFGMPRGLNTRDITEGTLDDNGRRAYQAVLDDWQHNPDYGHCLVVQVERGATVASVEARLAGIARQFPVDLAIWDYLQLWKPSRPRQSRREELSEIVMETKQVASTFQDGKGLSIISPWQVNRAGREAAKANGGVYTYEALAETAESVNTADILLTLFDPDNDPSMGRSVPIEAAVLKNRDGERGGSLRLTADFANACFDARDNNAGADLFALEAG